MTLGDDTPAGKSGLTASAHIPRQPDVLVDGDASLVQLHSAMLDDGLADAVVPAVAQCPGDRRDDYKRVLREVGVDALDGRLADALATLAAGTDPEADSARAYAWRAVRHLLDGLGGNVDGQASGREDIMQALPPLLAAATDPASTPTVAVRLGVGWSSRPCPQRDDVLRYLARLGAGADVVLVVTDAAAHRIDADHRDALPTHVLRQTRNRHGRDRAHDARETAADAVASLDPDGRPVGVVRALSRSATDSLTYPELASAMALDSAPYEAARTAETHGLVERTERADGRTVVSLRPAGDCLLDSLSAADGGRASPSSAAVASSGSQTGDSEPPQIPPAMPCYPPAWDGPPGPETDADGDARPPSAAAESADMDRVERWQTGLVTPRYADRVDWMPACAHAEPGAVSLVDVDLSDRLDADRDGRAPSVSYDSDTDTAYVGLDYSNPMQSAVTLAHGLTSDLLLDALDAGERMGEDLRGLDIHERPVLWGATCLGWLPASVDDGAEYVDALTDARQDLLSLSGAAAHDDTDVTRSQVTRQALGLVGTLLQVLDLLGVDVVTEVRVPECSRHFGSGNSDRRGDLLDHLRMLSALSSRVGAFSAFRQLHEDREDRRLDGFTLGFDGDGPPSAGSMSGAIVVTGDGVEGLAGELTDDGLDPRPVHPDAPPVSVSVDVEIGTSRRRTSRTCRRMLRARGLRPTPAAVGVLSGVAATAWDAAAAIHWGLESEDRLRDVHLDECRRALATLGPDRILDESPRSARAGVAALLDADRPLSQTELADRAGISAQSWRNHRDSLVAADWVRETPDGWRVSLPFRSERDADESPVADPPWWLSDEVHHASDVLTWLHYDRGALDGDPLDPDDALGHALEVTEHGLPRAATDPAAARAALDESGVPPDLVLSRCSASWCPPSTATVAMGRSTTQTSLV